VAKWEEEVKKKRLELTQQAIATETSPWLRFTDWERVLAESKLDLVATYELTTTATTAKPELQRVLEVWNIILDRCLETLESMNYKDVLKWWASPKPESPGQRPFELVERSSLAKYRVTFVRLLFYVLRTAPEDEDSETETGVMYNQRQWQCVQEVRSRLQEPAVVADDSRLTTAVMALIISLVTEDVSQMSQYENPIMHYMAVRGINTATRTFRTPVLYTPILAQMLWMIRLVMLEIAVSDEGWPELGIQCRVDLGAVAGAVAARVKKIRLQHLVEGSYSPASIIIGQLAYGQAINKTTQAPSNIFWSDDRQTVFYDGKGVAVTKIRAMCQALIVELQGLLHKLLFHQDVPLLPLAKFVDSMGHSQLFQQDGYSFVDHAENTAYTVDWQFLYQQMQRDDAQYRLAQVRTA
jgi:hypothetical protein